VERELTVPAAARWGTLPSTWYPYAVRLVQVLLTVHVAAAPAMLRDGRRGRGARASFEAGAVA
jgi:hypothetical protein